jgi:ligand-binding sensor domain-containing protein
VGGGAGARPRPQAVTRWGASALPSTTIRSLVQTRDRRLWLATAAGLVRFDGADFVLFTSASDPSLEEGGVSRLAQGQDGALYIGTTAGAVLRYADGVFTPTVPAAPTSARCSRRATAASG